MKDSRSNWIIAGRHSMLLNAADGKETLKRDLSPPLAYYLFCKQTLDMLGSRFFVREIKLTGVSMTRATATYSDQHDVPYI